MFAQSPDVIVLCRCGPGHVQYRGVYQGLCQGLLRVRPRPQVAPVHEVRPHLPAMMGMMGTETCCELLPD